MKNITLSLLSLVSSIVLFSCSSSVAFSQESQEPQDGNQSSGTQQKSKITAVIIADTQIGFSDNNKSYTQDSLNLELTVRKINQIRPDFVVLNGDMVNTSGSKKQLACFFEVIEKLDSDIPLWYVPGNHDMGNGTKDEKIAGYIDKFGYDRFSFTADNATFIGINSCIIKDERIEYEEEQLKWLKRALRAAMKKNNDTYIFCHHSFFTKKYDEEVTYSNQSFENRDKYWALFKEFKVKAVFAGHLHEDKTGAHDGIDMITVGPVSKPLGKGVSGVGICSFEEGSYEYHYIPLKDL